MNRPPPEQPKERYGKLKIVEEKERIGEVRQFLCHCDCGAIKLVSWPGLRRGKTNSCGCLVTAANSRAKGFNKFGGWGRE